MKVEKEDWELSQTEEGGWTCWRHEEPEPNMVIDDDPEADDGST